MVHRRLQRRPPAHDRPRGVEGVPGPGGGTAYNTVMSGPIEVSQTDDGFAGQVREEFRRLAAGLVPGRPMAVLCHSDADGLAAGAILARALRRAGHAVAAEATGKGEDAWAPAVAGRLARHSPQALLVADLGSRDRPVLDGVPTLLLDHHRPDGVPPGATLVSGYGRDPTPTSGLLAYRAAGAVADVADLLWIAAISLLSDLGDDPPFAELGEARRRYMITPLREATSLLNAPRRSASGDATPALRLLLEADGPRAITRGDSPDALALRATKAEAGAAFAEAKRAAPVVVGDVALIRLHTPCQVHPLVARTWGDRLPKSIVIAANSGYLPGRVNFAVRSATGRDLLEFLRAHAPAGAGEAYGRGHDQATGGSLSFEA